MPNPAQPKKAVKTAVITGGHDYDVENFRLLFRRLRGVDAYVQYIDEFALSSQDVRNAYDVVLFYTWLLDTPSDEGLPWYRGTPRSMLDALGSTQQGIFILHHSILNYPDWQPWNDMVGIQDRRFEYFDSQSVNIHVAGPTHPITRGLQDWTMTDETYRMADASAGSTVLLTTDHPNSLSTLAWTRTYRASRLFCFESGHDNSAYANPNFQSVLRRGILWTSGRI